MKVNPSKATPPIVCERTGKSCSDTGCRKSRFKTICSLSSSENDGKWRILRVYNSLTLYWWPARRTTLWHQLKSIKFRPSVAKSISDVVQCAMNRFLGVWLWIFFSGFPNPSNFVKTGSVYSQSQSQIIMNSHRPCVASAICQRETLQRNAELSAIG